MTDYREEDGPTLLDIAKALCGYLCGSLTGVDMGVLRGGVCSYLSNSFMPIERNGE